MEGRKKDCAGTGCERQGGETLGCESPGSARRPVSIAEAADYLRSAPYPNLVFDLDDTLYHRSDPYIRACRTCFSERRQREKNWPGAEELFRVSRKFMEEEYKRRIRGEIGMEEMLIRRTARTFAACSVTLSDREALEFEAAYEKAQGELRPVREFAALLEELSASPEGPFLGVLTNGPFEHQWNKIRALGLTRWIPAEHILVSEELGLAKPDPAIFRAYKERCGILPEETLMIGDNPEADIFGAEHAGWHALWVRCGVPEDMEAAPGETEESK